MENFHIFLAIFSTLLPGYYAPFVNLGTGCVDDTGTQHQPGDVWYVVGECTKYGCFTPDNPSAYKMTCPEAPKPDCNYELVSSPGAPFPNCCVTPECVPTTPAA